MFSAATEIEEQVLALNAGCDDFIVKPINFQILEAKIKSFRRIARMQQQIAGQLEELLRYSSIEAEERRLCSFLMERLERRDLLDNPRIRYAQNRPKFRRPVAPARGDLYVMLADVTGQRVAGGGPGPDSAGPSL
jgi:DNA-binding response OmpR family regulator